MSDARFRHVYTGPTTLWGLTRLMPVRVRAHPRGTSRLTRLALTPIECESGEQWSVPRGQVVERSLIAGLFGDGARD